VTIVRNKANFGGLGRDGPAVAAPNKANSAEVEGWASTRWRRSYGQLNMQKVSMKQSQYAPGEGIGGASPARGCNCAKQTQFRPAGGQQAASRGGPFVRNKANFGLVPFSNRVRWRQTNPIQAWGAGTGGRNLRNKADLRPPREIGGASPILHVGATASNKANSGRPAGSRPRRAEGHSCETKPISPAVPGGTRLEG